MSQNIMSKLPIGKIINICWNIPKQLSN